MMTSRDRVLKALNFEPTDRVPRDLSGMRSTGISAFAYPRLRAALGLPARLPRVYDSGQMLALPDLDVLDALGCDVVTVEGQDVTNAFEQPELWRPYDFGGRLPALVRDPEGYRAEPDGALVYRDYLRMPPASYVFDSEHAGQLFVLDGELPRPDLDAVRRQQEGRVLKDEQVVRIREFCRRVRSSTDRAVFFSGPLGLGICIHGFGGLAVFPVLCLLEPDMVHEIHSLCLEAALKNARALLPEIKDYVDVVATDSDDWGNQNALMAPPRVFRDLFLPYRRRHNAEMHRIAPAVKTFLHSCGALYEILDMLVESGTDVLNPVQWSAGGHSPAEWMAKVRGRMSLWGGGVDAQHTLPLGSVAEVEREVAEVVGELGQGGGYVFANTHNILAEIAPEKVVAMYRVAGKTESG
jgi:uroporphyrinogen decarboxylase